jgi:hypothetical protein
MMADSPNQMSPTVPRNLEKLLDEKRKQTESRRAAFVDEKNEWIQRLDTLFQTIQSWLDPLVKKGHVSLRLGRIGLEEEPFGPYLVPWLRITFYNGRAIELKPAGWFVVGAKGRVDMDIGTRDVKIVGGEKKDEWDIAANGGFQQGRIPLTRENFEQLVAEFVSSF